MDKKDFNTESNIMKQIEQGSFEHQCFIFIFQGEQLLDNTDDEYIYEKLKECFRISRFWQSELKKKLYDDLSLPQEKLVVYKYLLNNLDELNEKLKQEIRKIGITRNSHESEFQRKNESINFDEEGEEYEEDDEDDYDENSQQESEIKEFTEESKRLEESNNKKESMEIEEKQELKLGDNLTPEILKKLYRKDDHYYKRLDSGDLVKLNMKINEIEEQEGKKRVIRKVITLSMPRIDKNDIEAIKKSQSQNGNLKEELNLEEFKERFSKKLNDKPSVICSNQVSEENNIIKQESYISNFSKEKNNLSKEKLRIINEKLIQSNERENISNKNEFSQNNSGYQEMQMPFQSTNELDNLTKFSKASSGIKDSVTNLIMQTNKIDIDNFTDQERISEEVNSNIDRTEKKNNDNSDTQKNFYTQNPDELYDIENIQTKDKFYQKNNINNNENNNNIHESNKPDENYFKIDNDDKHIYKKYPTTDARLNNNYSNLGKLIKNNKEENNNINNSKYKYKEINKTIDLNVEDALEIDKSDVQSTKEKIIKKKIQSFSDMVKESCENNDFTIDSKKDSLKKQKITNEDKTKIKRRVISIDNKNNNKSDNINNNNNSNKDSEYKMNDQVTPTKVISPLEASFENNINNNNILPPFLKSYILPFIPFIHEELRWVLTPSKKIKVINANLNSSFNSHLKNSSFSNFKDLLNNLREVPNNLYSKNVVAPLGYENVIIDLINSNLKEEKLEHVSLWANDNSSFFDDLLKLWKTSTPYSYNFNPSNYYLNKENELFKIKEEFEDKMNDSSIHIDVRNRENFNKEFKKEFLMFNGKKLNLLPFYSFDCNKQIQLSCDSNGNFNLTNKKENQLSNFLNKLSINLNSEQISNNEEEEESYITMKNKSLGQLKPFYLNEVEINIDDSNYCVYTSDDAEFRLVQTNIAIAPKFLFFKTNLLINLKEKLTTEEYNRYLIHWENEICNNKFEDQIDEVNKNNFGTVNKIFCLIPFNPNSFKPGIKLFASKCGELRILTQSQHKGKKIIKIEVASLNHSLSKNQFSNSINSNSLLGDDGSVFKEIQGFSFMLNKNVKMFSQGNIKILVNETLLNKTSGSSYKIPTLTQIRKKINSLFESKIENESFNSLKKSSFKKFLMVRGNLFVSLPFLKIFSSNDGETKIIDSRNKYLNNTEFFLKQEQPPFIQSSNPSPNKINRTRTVTIKDPHIDQLGFKRFKIKSCFNGWDNLKEVVSEDGERRIVVMEKDIDTEYLWYGYNVIQNGKINNYMMDEYGNRVEDVGEEIDEEDLLLSSKGTHEINNSFNDFKSNKNKQFILSKYPFFLYFYNPHLKFVNSVSDLKIINLNMFSFTSKKNNLPAQPVSDNKNVGNRFQNQILEHQSNTTIQNKNVHNPISNMKNQIQGHPNQEYYNSSSTNYQSNNSPKTNIGPSNNNSPSYGYHSKFTSDRKITKVDIPKKNGNQNLNTDYFGEYDSKPEPVRKKPIRYSSGGITVRRPNFISDSLKGTKGVRVLIGEEAINALKNSIQLFEGNYRRSISPSPNRPNPTYITTRTNKDTHIQSGRKETNTINKRNLTQEPAINNLGNYLNNKIEQKEGLKNLFSKDTKPNFNEFIKNRKVLKIQTENENKKKNNIFNNQNSKMISVGKLLNSLTNNDEKYQFNSRDVSYKTKSSIGHSVSIRSRSKSKIQDKSKHKFIPVSEYYERLDRKSRKIRESNKSNNSLSYNNIEGVKRKLNILSKSSKLNLDSNNVSNEYYRGYSQQRNVENNSSIRNYNSTEPQNRNYNTEYKSRIRHINNNNNHRNIFGGDVQINKEVQFESIKNSSLIKKNFQENEKNKQFLGQNLQRNNTYNVEHDDDFKLHSKDNYNHSWNHNVNVNKGLKNVYKNEEHEEDFGNYFKQNKNKYNQFNNNNNKDFKDKNYFNKQRGKTNVMVGKPLEIERKNSFDVEVDGEKEGDYQEELIIGNNVQRFEKDEYNPYEDEEEELGKTNRNNQYSNSYINKKQNNEDSVEEVYEEDIPLNNYRTNNDDEYNMYEDEEEELGKRQDTNQHNYRVIKNDNSGSRQFNSNVSYTDKKINNSSSTNRYNSSISRNNIRYQSPAIRIENSNRFSNIHPSKILSQREGSNVYSNQDSNLVNNSSYIPSINQTQVTLKNKNYDKKNNKNEYDSYGFQSNHTLNNKQNNNDNVNTQYSGIEYSLGPTNPVRVQSEYVGFDDITPKRNNQQKGEREYDAFVDEEEEMGITEVNPDNNKYHQQTSNLTFAQTNSNIKNNTNSNISFGGSKINAQSSYQKPHNNQWRYMGSSTSFQNSHNNNNPSSNIFYSSSSNYNNNTNTRNQTYQNSYQQSGSQNRDRSGDFNPGNATIFMKRN